MDFLGRQAGPDETGAERIRLEDSPAGDEFEDRHVGAVPVGDEDSLEAVVSNALGDVEDEVEQVLLTNVDRAGEVHVVRLKPVRDERHQQNVVGRAFGSFFADVPDQKVIDVERHVIAVIFDRSDRKNDDGLLLDPLAEFRPTVVVIEISFSRHD